MTEMQSDLDHFIGRIVRREVDAEGSIKVRADSIRGPVEVGQVVHCYLNGGSMPLTVTEVQDGWLTAELRPTDETAGEST